ncbi:hypothetical protein OQA88_10735 [Cercophora sp. LCS_1]
MKSLLFLLPSALAITILPGGDPRPFTPGSLKPATSETQFWNTSANNEFAYTSAEVLMSSYTHTKLASQPGIYPSGDSFVRGAIQAWGEHLHLIVRPEEVWFTILVQMNFYMNANAESLRSLFVDHEGQQVIYIEDYTWYQVLEKFQYAIQAKVKTDWLLDWIRPNFTTTTESDVMTANVLMMGLTKAYFKFEGGIVCGLPSVTLLGEEKDWVALEKKLERLADFGEEPKEYARRLKPILSRFVRSFREPDSKEIKDFWNNIAVAQSYQYCGAPPVSISGWITGFLFWTDKGKPYARHSGEDSYVLDGYTYPGWLDITKLPVGYATVPFIMRDFRDVDRFEAYVLAGTMGKQITPGPPAGYAEALKRAGGNLTLLEEGSKGLHSSIKPLSGWMLYGPRQHNVSTSQYSWVEEWDLVDLAQKLKSGQPRDFTCKA